MNPLILLQFMNGVDRYSGLVESLINLVQVSTRGGDGSIPQSVADLVQNLHNCKDELSSHEAYTGAKNTSRSNPVLKALSKTAINKLWIKDADQDTSAKRDDYLVLVILQLVTTLISRTAAQQLFFKLNSSTQNALSFTGLLWASPNNPLLHRVLSMWINNPSSRIDLRRQIHYFAMYANILRVYKNNMSDSSETDPNYPAIMWNDFLNGMINIDELYKDMHGLWTDTGIGAAIVKNTAETLLEAVPIPDVVSELPYAQSIKKSIGLNGFDSIPGIYEFLSGATSERLEERPL